MWNELEKNPIFFLRQICKNNMVCLYIHSCLPCDQHCVSFQEYQDLENMVPTQSR